MTFFKNLEKKNCPEVHIGLSKFSSLRPEHVMIQSQTPENVCLCLYHENIRLLLEAVPNLPKRTGDFVSTIVCDPDNKDCMLQTCSECRELKKYRENIINDKDTDEICTLSKRKDGPILDHEKYEF